MSEIIDLLKQDNYYTESQERLAETYLGTELNKDTLVPEKKKGISHKLVAGIGLSTLIILLVSIYVLTHYSFSVDFKIDKKELFHYKNILAKKNISLIGSATMKRSSAVLTRTNDAGLSSIALNLPAPIDPHKENIFILAQCKNGKGGRLSIVLRDGNYRSHIQDNIEIEYGNTTSQPFIIPINRSNQSIDFNNIRHIRLELTSGEELTIKKIGLINNERV